MPSDLLDHEISQILGSGSIEGYRWSSVEYEPDLELA